MAAATAGQGINNASFMELQAMKHYSSSKLPTFGRRSANMSIKRYVFSSCSLSMNGCQGDDHDPRAPIGTIETRTFPAVSTPALAVESLNAAIADMQSQPSASDSGIIRLELSYRKAAYDIKSHALVPHDLK
nr:isochorismate synthase, chloroplastic-like [Coffea arabica]